MSQVDSIVFDLGNVLIGWDPRNLYQKVFSQKQEMEEFLSSVCSMDWNHSLDGGRDWVEAIAEKVSEHPQYESEIRMYHSRWEEMLLGPIEASVAVLEELYKEGQCRLLALTNWSHETWPIALKNFSYLELFEGIVVSGHEGVCKPDREIFDLLVRRYELVPEKTYFTDDSLKNIEAAQRLGFQTHHFVDSQGLKEDLTDRGLL